MPHLCSRHILAQKAYFAASVPHQSQVTRINQSDYPVTLAVRLHFSFYHFFRTCFDENDKTCYKAAGSTWSRRW